MQLPSFAALLKRLAILFVASALFGQAHAQAPLPAKDKLPAAKLATKLATKPSSKVQGLLFEISRPDAAVSSKKTYLFGSIHIAKPDFYPLSKPVLKAYQQADTVAVEADTTNEAANKNVVDQLTYVAPDQLQAHLSPSTWELLQSMTGPAIAQFQSYKPIMVAMGLTVSASMQLGFDPAKGLDLYFIRSSQQDKKRVVELESVAFQAEVLAGLNDEEGNAILASTLNSFRLGEVANELNRIAAAWKAGDTQALSKILLEAGNKDEGSKILMTRLMDERNAGMAEKITALMSEGKSLFAVVGAGHLAGENSLLELLKKQGLQVKQVK